MEGERCRGTTRAGERCKNIEGKCRYHKCPTKRSPSATAATLIRSKEILPPSPDKKKSKVSKRPSLLEKHYRGVSERACYDDLGFKCDLARSYSMQPQEGKILYPEEFQIVARHLMEVCKTAIGGKCIMHPTMPGIQWDNTDKKSAYTANEKMHNVGNHYFHSVRKAENPVEIFGKEDVDRCICNNEYLRLGVAFETLQFLSDPDLSVSDLNEKWKEHHGLLQGWIPRPRDGKVSGALRQKILKDSIDFLAQEYKIHLQPKPEYQIPVLRELIKLLKTDKNFRGVIESWKAVIPYSQVLGEINLPAIVIYPAPGHDNAKLAIQKIIEHFEGFDVSEIGLDHTPRFNYRYNPLVFWANGSGDHKKMLPAKYFSSEEKVFYKNHELVL